jgi:hypothetical protein
MILAVISTLIILLTLSDFVYHAAWWYLFPSSAISFQEIGELILPIFGFLHLVIGIVLVILAVYLDRHSTAALWVFASWIISWIHVVLPHPG